MAKKIKISSQEWQTYKRLMRYACPYWKRLLIGTFFGLLFGGSTAGMLAAVKSNFSTLFDPQVLDLWQIFMVALLLPLFAAVRGVGDFLSMYLVEWVGNRVVMDLRNATFGHIHDLSLDYFSASRTGELISRTTNDSMMVQRAVSTVLGDLIRQPFVLLFVVGYVIYLDPMLSLISLVLFPVCIVPVAIFGRRVRRSAREGQQKLADLVSILQETINGVRIVKAFGMEQREKDRFSASNRSVFNRLMRVARARNAVEPIIVFISLIGLALALVFAKWADMGADIITFGAALVMMYEPAKKLSRIHISIQESSAGADRIFEILDTPISVKDRPDAIIMEEKPKHVAFTNVAFSYETKPVLADISFTAEAGQCVAFVGGSGAGKTTLVSLLPRFFDVGGGCISINGHDIREYTIQSLRAQMGIVTQDTVLFNDTVANNISYGSPHADMESIRKAAEQAHALSFIEEMEFGFDSMIGEGGVKLSGGQRQRLSIARAMLRNPPILILDEATSALDTESERQVQAALDALMVNRTVFAIAHRLSTIAHADKIIVLDKGLICEEGTHDELLARNGAYRRLYELQFKGQS